MTGIDFENAGRDDDGFEKPGIIRMSDSPVPVPHRVREGARDGSDILYPARVAWRREKDLVFGGQALWSKRMTNGFPRASGQFIERLMN